MVLRSNCTRLALKNNVFFWIRFPIFNVKLRGENNFTWCFVFLRLTNKHNKCNVTVLKSTRMGFNSRFMNVFIVLRDKTVTKTYHIIKVRRTKILYASLNVTLTILSGLKTGALAKNINKLLKRCRVTVVFDVPTYNVQVDIIVLSCWDKRYERNSIGACVCVRARCWHAFQRPPPQRPS